MKRFPIILAVVSLLLLGVAVQSRFCAHCLFPAQKTRVSCPLMDKMVACGEKKPDDQNQSSDKGEGALAGKGVPHKSCCCISVPGNSGDLLEFSLTAHFVGKVFPVVPVTFHPGVTNDRMLLTTRGPPESVNRFFYFLAFKQSFLV